MLNLAYPEAELVFLGEREQGHLMLEEADEVISSRLRVIGWDVHRDSDTLPLNVIARGAELFRKAFRDICSANMIVFTSASGPCISAVRMFPRAKKQQLQVFIHGDYSELIGWRSRNPFRRKADLYGAVARAAEAGATIFVLEAHIKHKAHFDLPELAKSIFYFPHPRIEKEVLKSGKKLTYPVNIGLAGSASLDKGIKQLIALAKLLNEDADLGKYRFHAIGTKHPSSREEDFSDFETQPVNQQMERVEYLSLLDKMHFLFFWPTGAYYENASSGALYDAINRKIPIIASSRVAELFPELAKFAIVGDSILEVVKTLRQTTDTDYRLYQEAIINYEKKYDEKELTWRYRQITKGEPQEKKNPSSFG
jgi:hypothetical protein